MKQIKAFLSHNSLDKPFVETIANKLVKQGIDVWYDKWNLVPGVPWQEEIEDALSECDGVLVFIGKHGLGNWHNEEMRIAISRRVDSSKTAFKVIPILLPFLSKEEIAGVPGLLKRATWIQFKESAEELSPFELLVTALKNEQVVKTNELKPGIKPDIEKIYKLLGATIDNNIHCDSRTQFIARFKKGPFSFESFVHCIETPNDELVLEADIKEVLFKLSQVKRNIAIERFFIISSSAANDYARKLCLTEKLEFLTIVELYNQLVDFNDYITHSIRQYEESNLFKYYVPQQGSDIEDYQLLLETEINGGVFHTPLDEYVDQLFANKQYSRMAILGNFGIGKTSFCQHYFYKLLKKYREDPKKRIPIYLNLREFRAGLDIQQVLVNHLQKQPKIDVSLDLFLELQRMGRFIFILDSLDEMATKVDRIVLNENLREIDRLLAEGDNLYLISCRTHFFHERITDEVLEDYKVFFVTEWGQNELKLYFEKRYASEWEYYYNKVNAIPNLTELSKNPMLLEMIVKSLSEITQDQDITSSLLHETYTNQWINQQTKRRGSVMTREQRAYFVLELAAKLYKENLSELHYSELHVLAARISGLSDSTRIDYFDTDARTSTFITKNSIGFYGFRHRSFLEFFCAKNILAGINSSGDELLSIKVIPDEILNFIIEMKLDQGGIDNLLKWSERFEIPNLSRNSANILRGFKINLPDIVSRRYGIDAEDSKLWNQVLTKNDEVAFNHIIEKYYDDVYKYSYRSEFSNVLNSADIEDAIQESILAIWQQKDKVLKGSFNFRNYFITIVRYRMKDKMRNRGNTISITESIENSFRQIDDGNPEYLNQLLPAINLLPVLSKHILLDSFYNNLTLEQLGAKYDIKVSLVRNIKSRALTELRKILKNNPDFTESFFES